MRIRDLIAHLQSYDPDDPVAAGTWLAADVEKCAGELGVTLTDNDVGSILDKIHDDHDASLVSHGTRLNFTSRTGRRNSHLQRAARRPLAIPLFLRDFPPGIRNQGGLCGTIKG